ncbi:DinB family protein [Planctomicrobium piriforme]|uniref:DinB superfamily protein n=1 Tax=Planctomicrobium piriforme TaxID=1576369 RepID=A0A1I3IEE7_9PLAN|nr:DinB family protein [Planctomicrobium piriforme]SFI46348.1 DinB superfamily protein [Planctomicrobium piriforme]
MEIELTPTLIDMYRETFEGEVKPGWCWITSGPADMSVLGSLAGLTADEAYAAPKPGRKSIAAHAAHLKFTLELTLKRLHGENPPADWPGSFQVGEQSPAAWEQLQEDLHAAYQGVLAFFDQQRDQAIEAWQPIQVAGLVAMIGHNAYHLGAIRQLMLNARD